MKITVSSKELKQKLSTVSHLGNDTTMPILDNLLLSSNGNSQIIATNLTTSIRESIDIENVECKGTVGIPRKKLYEIVNQLPPGDVTIESAANHRVVIQSGLSKFKLAGIDPADYPTYPEIEATNTIVMNAQDIIEMLDRTMHCADGTNSNVAMNCVLFHFIPSKNILQVVATNAHRMAIISKELEIEMDKELKLLISKTAAQRLKQFLSSESEESSVIIGMSDNNVRFSVNQREIIIRLVEGTFPNYGAVLKGIKTNKELHLPLDKFTASLKRALIISKERSNTVKLELKDNKLIISSSQDAGELKDEIQIDYKGESCVSKFNGQYILDALSTFEKDAVLKLGEQYTISLLQESERQDYQYVVMPMR